MKDPKFIESLLKLTESEMLSLKFGKLKIIEKGYTEDNVHMIHKDINRMRNKFNLEYFIKICKLIAKNNE